MIRKRPFHRPSLLRSHPNPHLRPARSAHSASVSWPGSSMAPHPASRRSRSDRLHLLSLSLVLLLSTDTTAAAVEAEGDAAHPHCADFLQHCAWNASTSSCEFRESVSFVCGPRSAAEPPVAAAAGSGSLLDAVTVSAASFEGDSNAEDVEVGKSQPSRAIRVTGTWRAVCMSHQVWMSLWRATTACCTWARVKWCCLEPRRA